MAIPPDPRYDLLLVDSPDGTTANEVLPLMLVEQGGALAINSQTLSSYANQVTDGPPTDRNSTRGTVRSQKDWRGGRGLLTAYGDTNRYYDGTIDSRFGVLMLPPAAQVGIVTTDPAFSPAQAAGALGRVSAVAKFERGDRVDDKITQDVRWVRGNRVDSSSRGGYTWVDQTPTQYAIADTGIIGIPASLSTLGLRISQQITPPSATSFTQINLYTMRQTIYGAPVTARVLICANSGGAPGAVLATSGASVINEAAGWTSFAFSSAVTMNSGTVYWIVFEMTNASSGGAARWYSTTITTGLPPAMSQTVNPADGSLGAWTSIPNKGFLFFLGGAIDRSKPGFTNAIRSNVKLAQGFVTTGAVGVIQVQAYLGRAVWEGSPTLTLRLRNTSNHSPGATVIASATATPGAGVTWVTFTLSASLAAASEYAIELEGGGATAADSVAFDWYCNAGPGHSASGAVRAMSTDGGAWGWLPFESYFIINTLASSAPRNYTHDKQAPRYENAFSFTPASNVSMTKVGLILNSLEWVGSPTVTLSLHSNVAGSPDSPGAQITSATVANPGATITWKEINISAALVAGTKYWLKIVSDAPTASDSAIIQMWVNVGDNRGTEGTSVWKDATASTWMPATSVTYFYINAFASGNPYVYNYQKRVAWEAQSFTPSAAVSMTHLRVFAQLQRWDGSAAANLVIYSGASPGVTAVLTIPLTQTMFDAASARTQMTWVKIDGAASLASGTQYWLAIETTAPAVGDAVEIDWGYDTGAGFAAGQIRTSNVANDFTQGAWTATPAGDLFFTINVGGGLGSQVAHNPAEHGGNWYVAAGTLIYRYVPGSNTWTQVYSAAATVTALTSFGGKLYAALGDANDMVSSADGTTWAAATGTWKSPTNPGNFRYTYLRAFNGYLYVARFQQAGTHALAYSNGTDWWALNAASSEVSIRGLANFGGELAITAQTGLYFLSGDLVYQAVDFALDNYINNGRRPVSWIADGKLYFPIRHGLVAYNGAQLKPVGPDLDDGLPLPDRGVIAAMAGTRNWLFAALQNVFVNGYSGVYVYNGAGWHRLARGAADKPIRAIGMESFTSTSGSARVWWFESDLPMFLEMPSASDDPRGQQGVKFAPSGSITSCRIGGELARVQKELQAVTIATQTAAGTGWQVEVYIDVNGADLWSKVGTVTQSPTQELRVRARTFAPKLVGAGSTANVIELNAGTPTADLSVGDFVRIGERGVGQISIINNAARITLVAPLPGGIPTAGERVFPATPTGYDFRYRLVLSTTNQLVSPIVERVSLQYQEFLTDRERLSFSVRAEDRMEDRAQGTYPHTAREVRTRLADWAKRLTSFILVEPDGTNHRVKIINASFSSPAREEDTRSKVVRIKRRIDVIADEVPSG